MIPTDLVLDIAGTRETLPFPAVIEVIIMELAFEFIREAGVRIPTSIGPTIGIVGALILGQAAVDANIVSPILVIVVSITGIASFAVADVSFSYMARICKLLMVLSASILGFFGVSTFVTIMIGYLVRLTSFGVPFLSPLSPHYPSSKDIILRPPVWKQWLRPLNLLPKDKQRKEKPRK
jgi:spore germination protein KA